MKVLFFAWLKDEIGIETYNLSIEKQLTVEELKHLLISKLGSKAEVLNSTNILCAVNLNLESNSKQILNDTDEVAFFPPVTGG